MKEISKTYSVTVKFRYSEYIRGTTEYKDIAETDEAVKALSTEIRERIEKSCRISSGSLNSQPSVVHESDY